jgi:serine/threonine protein kinase
MPNSRDSASTLRRIFLAALEIDDQDERNAFLATECGDNIELRLRIERMCATELGRPNLLASAIENLASLINAITHSDAWQNWLEGKEEQTPAERSCASPTDTEEVSKAFGPYTIIRKLGLGGMGSVYLAHHQSPIERKVALKVINPGMDSRQVLARFRLEQKALEGMNHPNITNILDAGLSSSGCPYLVMEWVNGVRVDKFCRENAVDIASRLRLFIDICLAVHHAHQRGIIHRDLKPSNIMIVTVDGHLVPKVIDFGIAKALDTPLSENTRLTGFPQILGTPEYMSPEQAAWGEIEIDTRSDVYSLGSLLYILVTGGPPFDCAALRKAGPGQLLRFLQKTPALRPSQRIVNNSSASDAATGRSCLPPDAEQLLGRIRSELDWIAMKALEKEPVRRYDSASLLAADVKRFLDSEPIEARPPSATYRFSRFASRHRLVLGFTAALLLTAMLGGGMAIRYGLQSIVALKQAKENELKSSTLLEVSRLQTMLASVPKNVLGTIADDLPREADGSLLGTTVTGDGRGTFTDGSLREMVTRLMQPKPELTLKHPRPIHFVAVAESMQFLAACCADGWGYVWDLKANKVVHRLVPHLGITTAAFSPDTETLLTGDQDGYGCPKKTALCFRTQLGLPCTVTTDASKRPAPFSGLHQLTDRFAVIEHGNWAARVIEKVYVGVDSEHMIDRRVDVAGG